MTTEANKDLIRQFFTGVFNEGNIALVDEIAVADYDDHSPLPGQGAGIEGLRQRIVILRSAFPDFTATLDDLVAEGDRLAVRWTTRATHSGELFCVPPSGKSVTITGMDFYGVRDGKLAEHWDQVDLLGFLQQVGAIPAPGQPAA